MSGYEDIRDKTNENTDAITLRDGTQITLRQVKNSDVILIQEMHERLSKDSIYYRYLGPYKPSLEDLQHQCSLDGGPGMAMVATLPDQPYKVVAVACYRGDPGNPSSVEPAILVEDEYQGRGLGKRLLLGLCHQAARRGVKIFKSNVHPTNQPVIHMIQSCGLPCESKYNDGLKEIRVWLN
jgi:GNAT superfamily N-acetyltransferase